MRLLIVAILTLASCAESKDVLGDGAASISCEEASVIAGDWFAAATADATDCVTVDECTTWLPSQPSGRAFGFCTRAVRSDAVDELEEEWSSESLRIGGLLAAPCNSGVICQGAALACTDGRCTIQ